MPSQSTHTKIRINLVAAAIRDVSLDVCRLQVRLKELQREHEYLCRRFRDELSLEVVDSEIV